MERKDNLDGFSAKPVRFCGGLISRLPAHFSARNQGMTPAALTVSQEATANRAGGFSFLLVALSAIRACS